MDDRAEWCRVRDSCTDLPDHVWKYREHHIRFIMPRILFLHSLLPFPQGSYIIYSMVLFIFKNTLQLSK